MLEVVGYQILQMATRHLEMDDQDLEAIIVHLVFDDFKIVSVSHLVTGHFKWSPSVATIWKWLSSTLKWSPGTLKCIIKGGWPSYIGHWPTLGGHRPLINSPCLKYLVIGHFKWSKIAATIWKWLLSTWKWTPLS